MFRPSLQEFEHLAADAGLVPIYREIVADLDTPLTIFAKVAGGESHAFLFESLEGGEKWGRYSFIGFDPIVTMSSRGTQITITREGKSEQQEGDPLQALQALLKSFDACNAEMGCDSELLPRFFGGAVGFLGYDMVRFMERLPERNPPLAQFPDSAFMVPRTVLIYDNLRQLLTVVNLVQTAGAQDLPALYAKAQAEIEEVIVRLQAPMPTEYLGGAGVKAKTHAFTSNMSEEAFAEMVEAAKEYVQAGDVIQVVLSQRFHTKTELSPFKLYRALRHINPSPYLFYLKLGDLVQIGSSPEILVRLEQGDIELRPIAGTRKRGKTEEEDAALEQELLADPKERAEHLMLVDLGRNDVGRVAQYGSVEVRDLLVVERYSHVMHLVSGVHGTLAPGKDQFDVLRACFPAGTVSGAPKIRAMEIIEELEPERRGPYAGSVGYFGFSGNMDFCITIRTFVMQGDDLWVQAGAGIVADSVSALEYQETINKSMGLRRAVELAEKEF
ncbi:anthranilate synthase component I [Thiovibrio frasassiensis]|uniref:Anthranilate synthase component 1 n=1 Tax=Thiovibrio frasassiensis TaxID=2984131 RepID=A0A9X4MBU7_9BACT|nr:anthranilate synthase component I [Thiovibrio frasassiensis]MDG4474601.1 anthranilate synthase component I [Thiovibrio frasassiensis]